MKTKMSDGFIVLTQEHCERYYKAAPTLSDVRIFLTFNFLLEKQKSETFKENFSSCNWYKSENWALGLLPCGSQLGFPACGIVSNISCWSKFKTSGKLGITHHFRRTYRIYLNLIEENWKFVNM